MIATIAKRTLCPLATTSPAERAHSAGVVDVWIDGAMWIHTIRTSRKGRYIDANPDVGVSIRDPLDTLAASFRLDSTNGAT